MPSAAAKASAIGVTVGNAAATLTVISTDSVTEPLVAVTFNTLVVASEPAVTTNLPPFTAIDEPLTTS